MCLSISCTHPYDLTHCRKRKVLFIPHSAIFWWKLLLHYHTSCEFQRHFAGAASLLAAIPYLLHSTFYKYLFPVTAIPGVCQASNIHSTALYTPLFNRCWKGWEHTGCLFSAWGLKFGIRAIPCTTARAFKNPHKNLLVILTEPWIVSWRHFNTSLYCIST